MNATEARLLTMAAKNSSLDDEEKNFINIVKIVSAKISDCAMDGKSKAVIDLKESSIQAKTKNLLKRLQENFERDGYSVELKLTRTPDGAREMIVEW